MEHVLSAAAFNDFLDTIIEITKSVVDSPAALKTYIPSIASLHQDDIEMAVLSSEGGDPIQSHDQLLEMIHECGKLSFAALNTWPDAVLVSYQNEGGISIYGCTSDGRTCAANLNYPETGGIEVELIYYQAGSNQKVSLSRNPAAWFYAIQH